MELTVNSILWFIIGAIVMWIVDWFLYGRNTGDSHDSHASHDDHGHDAHASASHDAEHHAEIDGYKAEIANLNAKLDASTACEDKLAAAEAKIADLEAQASASAAAAAAATTAMAADTSADASVVGTEGNIDPAAMAEADPGEPDDLKKIEGIGPKISGVLNDAGIYTFAQLAAAPVAALEKIVREDAGITIAFPDTWPQQAGLAASGNWEELARLQDSLKGGRQVK